jgi:tetratricopeptide (TPR) repeat protein
MVFAMQSDEIAQLDYELQKKAEYDRRKHNAIQLIRQNSALSTYDQYVLLFEQYQSFNYDTAFTLVNHMLDEARLRNRPDYQVKAELKRAFIYLSSGLFHESLEVFTNMNPATLSTDDRIYYYTHFARLKYDMADYVQGDLSYIYIREGNTLSEKALALIPPSDTVLYWSTSALYRLKMNDYPRAIEQFKLALACSSINEHEKAIAYSSMAHAYTLQNQTELADAYLIQAAISDLKSSTKETVALALVAQRLYRSGDLQHAAYYIREAMDDAEYYNARHRQLSVGRIMPIIEQEQLQTLEHTNHRIALQSILLYLLLTALGISLILLGNRMRAIRKAQATIQTMNDKLLEANRIKEEYIGTSCYSISELLTRLERYERFVRRKAQEKRTDELIVIPNYIDAHLCRRNFHKQLDQSFLHIFPNFIRDFNALLREGEQLTVKSNELLSPELRIFALMHLGINDNDQISKVLDYSINTVYTYKTRVRNRSDLDNEAFFSALMSIQSF